MQPTILRFCLPVLVGLLWVASAYSQGKTAIIIGISDYDDSVLKNPNVETDPRTSGVAHCKNNAKELERIFTNMGFKTYLLNTKETATKKNIEKQFTDLKDKKGDMLVVVFMGHGGRKGEYDYVFPADAKIEEGGKLKNVLTHAELRTYTLRPNAEKVLTIIDACRNKVTAITADFDEAKIKKDYEATTVKTKYDAMPIIYSCDKNSRTLLGKEDGTAFARGLIRVLLCKPAHAEDTVVVEPIKISKLAQQVKNETKKALKKQFPNPSPEETQEVVSDKTTDETVIGNPVSYSFANEELSKSFLAGYLGQKLLWSEANFSSAYPKEPLSFAKENLCFAKFEAFNSKAKDKADAKTDHKLDFAEAELIGANFKNACLKGANFQKALLAGANFSGADLRGADFTGTNLRRGDIILTGAQLEGAKGLDNVK